MGVWRGYNEQSSGGQLMTISIVHSTVATLPDEAGAEINKAEWNAAHSLSGAAANQVLFGNAGGSIAQSANLVFDSNGNLVINGAPAGALSTDKLQVAGDSLLYDIRITSGQINANGGLNVSAGNNGNLIIYGGSGSGVDPNPGSFQMVAGNPDASGANGGDIYIQCSNGSDVGYNGGVLYNYSGNESVGGTPGFHSWGDIDTLYTPMTFTPKTGILSVPYVETLQKIALTKLSPTTSQTITAGYSGYVCGPYEIVTATSLEIGAGACFEIG